MYCLCLPGVCRVQVCIIVPIEDDLYLPVYVLLSTCYSRAHTLFSLGTRLATVLWPSHMKERSQLVDNCGFQVDSLVLQTRPFLFHITNGFQYWSHTESNRGCGTERQGVVTSKSPVEAFVSGNISGYTPRKGLI